MLWFATCRAYISQRAEAMLKSDCPRPNPVVSLYIVVLWHPHMPSIDASKTVRRMRPIYAPFSYNGLTVRRGIPPSSYYEEYTPWLIAPQAAVLFGVEIRDVFARNLRAARRAKGLSQEELAHLVGIDRTYVSLLERCVYSATIDMVDRLAAGLDMEASALLTRTDSGAASTNSLRSVGYIHDKLGRR
jgi:DNA-binding XRE family transcriptional regulator